MKPRLILLAVPLVIVGLCSYNQTETALSSALCFREFSQWPEDVIVDDGVTVRVEHRHSNDPYFSLGHMGGVGSGDDDFSVMLFSLSLQHFRWSAARDERPVVLRRQAGRVWLVTFDRTDIRDVRFRFYEFSARGLAEEIPSDGFPKNLAIQNMWLKSQNGFIDGKPINEFDIVRSLDPGSHLFQESLTAKMWGFLEAGLPYERTVSPDILVRYKERHLLGASASLR